MKKLFISGILIFAVVLSVFAPVGAVEQTFTDEQGVTYTLAEDGKSYYVSAFDNSTTDVVILSEYNAIPVTSIGQLAFVDCRNLSSIVIPDSITYIGKGAFYLCVSLINVVFSENLEKIDNIAFQYSGLNELLIPEKANYIGEGAFYACRNLTYVRIPLSVKGMGIYAFDYCFFLETISCEATSKPDGWHKNWLGNCEATVIWGDGSSDASNIPDVSDEIIDTSDVSSDISNNKDNVSGNEGNDANGEYTIGDINGNGTVDMTDYILLKRAYFGTFELNDEQIKRGDVNGNGKIDMTDYILLKRAYFGTYTIKQPTLDSDCEATFDEVDPHVCDLKPTQIIAPTCKEQGYTIYICDCGMTEIKDIKPVVAHDLSGWKVTKEATATAEGEKQRNCNNCSYSETEVIEKLPLENIEKVILTEDTLDLLEERLRYHINQYRAEEGNCEMEMLDGKARLFAQGRAMQLQSNFEHDRNDRRKLATELEFGNYVLEYPNSYWDESMGKEVYTGEIMPAYYEPYGGEAIGCGVSNGSYVDTVAKDFARAFYNSEGHWSYVGSNDVSFVAIGASISYDGRVCVCVLVCGNNYDLEDW